MNDPLANWLRQAAGHVLQARPADLIREGPRPPAEAALRGKINRRYRLPAGLQSHRWAEVAILVEGEGFMEFRREQHRFIAPRLAILPAGVTHCEGYGDPASTYAALWLTGLESSLMALVSRHRPQKGWDFPYRGSLHGALVRRLSRWADAGRERLSSTAGEGRADWSWNDAAFEQFRADLLAVLVRLFQEQVYHRPAAPRPEEPWTRHTRMLEQIRSYLDGVLDRPITVNELAGLTRLTPRYINRLFRQWTGEPIHEYLIRRRMETALKLCRDGDLLVKEIAHRLGYDDPLYFSRAFHQYHGFSPAEARRKANM